MSLKFTWWFGVFALFIGVITLLGRILKWKWVFNKVENDDYWEFSHLFRYTIMPFIIASIAAYINF